MVENLSRPCLKKWVEGWGCGYVRDYLPTIQKPWIWSQSGDGRRKMRVMRESLKTKKKKKNQQQQREDGTGEMPEMRGWRRGTKSGCEVKVSQQRRNQVRRFPHLGNFCFVSVSWDMDILYMWNHVMSSIFWFTSLSMFLECTHLLLEYHFFNAK